MWDVKSNIMTTEEIFISNLLIAEFMGLEVLYGGFVHHKSAPARKVTKMKYHESWDWLMEVREKIKKTGNVYEFYIAWDNVDCKSRCEMTPALGYQFRTIYAYDESELTAVYTAIVQFTTTLKQHIKWLTL